jgi:TetR/AcrR family transcriptional regulator
MAELDGLQASCVNAVDEIVAFAERKSKRHAKRGERRRLQILQTLARMLESPSGEKITTASLAARVEVSEAALYRHFISKAQMYEELIEFIKNTLFSSINTITAEEPNAAKQVEAIVSLLLAFAKKNPGMTRVLIGDVLVNEDARLQTRINQLIERLESTLKRSLRFAIAQQKIESKNDPAPLATALISFVLGEWHQFAKSGFKRDPIGNWAEIMLPYPGRVSWNKPEVS